MKPKTMKVLYWVVTVIFCLAMLMSGISELLQTESSIVVMTHLGYPAYLNIILGVAKVLGVLAIFQWKFRTVKEWAYAGFLIDFIGAGASMYFSGDGILPALSPLIFIAVMFTSYFLGKKVEEQTKK
ncbi:MAG TPA: DoxX family protein [Candidatus Nanoarchaeia archaeon]|nr:DoxX family protein [Candidatus Nanoarchaeia archaeon]